MVALSGSGVVLEINEQREADDLGLPRHLFYIIHLTGRVAYMRSQGLILILRRSDGLFASGKV